MKTPIFTNNFIFKSLLLIIGTVSCAQGQNTNLTQDSKFEQLLNEKRKINSVIVINERYKIQVYSGNSEGAKKALADCKQQFKELDGTIVFNTPNYKVWIGNFKTRIEAERYIIEIKKTYPNYLLIKPQK
jgi:hypothetical protein